MNLKITYSTPLSTPPPPEDLWPDLLREKLIRQNRQFMRQHPPRPLPKCPGLWEAFNSNKPIIQRHNYTLKSHGEGPHSQYMHLSQSVNMPNQIDLCFPYMEQLAARKSQQYQEQLFSITNRITESPTLQTWTAICKDYVVDICFEQLVYLYLQMLAKGTQILDQYAEKYKCRPKILRFKVMQVRKLFTPRVEYNRLEYGDKINLDNFSRTCKILYCSICLTYDCTKHTISEHAVSHNYQYVRSYEVEQRMKVRKEQVIGIFRQIVAICSRKEVTAVGACSKGCYRLLNAERWDQLSRKRKNKAFSYIFRILLEMGTELFDFNPCKICTLFGKGGSYQRKSVETEVQCCEIFYYFMNDYALPNKLQYKFYSNEVSFLKNQSKELRSSQPARKRAKSKGKTKKTHKICSQSFNAVCFHYFSNCQPQDIGCFSCQCRKRGYCLPECQCSELCMLQVKGCKCKASSSGCLSNCPCYKEGRVCIPSRCQCFQKEECGTNCCENNQFALSSPKLTRVGESTIEGAGLGLFAGEMIRKNEFVIKYTGQLIESESIQKLRQSLGESGFFYNFKLNHEKSIDSRTFGNKSRFINHSLRLSNLRAETINIREEQLLIFRALRDIRQNEELFFDYNGGGDLTDHKDKYPFIE